MSTLQNKINKLTDMLLDDKISEEVYDEKYAELERKLGRHMEEKKLLCQDMYSQDNIQNRMKEIRDKLKSADMLDEFDRIVFESIVSKVIVGAVYEDGTVNPYKLTFVIKGKN